MTYYLYIRIEIHAKSIIENGFGSGQKARKVDYAFQ